MDTDELRQFIVQKRELLSRETFSRRAFTLGLFSQGRTPAGGDQVCRHQDHPRFPSGHRL